MPKLLYLISEDWFFASHFLPMARAARAAGFEVVVATRVTSHRAPIEAEGCRVISFDVARGTLAPFALLRGLAAIGAIVRAERPDIVHCIALRMILLGGFPAKLAGARSLVLAPTGLGYLWSSDSAGARLMRVGARAIMWLLRGPRTQCLFENNDDPAEFGMSPDDACVTIVPGAGVDPKDFPQTPEPDGPPIRIAVVSRMLKSKGIAEAVETVRLARAAGAAVILDLYGQSDSENPGAIVESDLRRWSSEPGIVWHGATNDVPAVWRTHHIALFLSVYREGLPRTLVEAAASGRPIVTTDVVGCRDVVRNGVEGFLVPIGDLQAVARAIEQLAADPALRARMGQAAHARFRERFTEETVKQVVTNLYRAMLARAP